MSSITPEQEIRIRVLYDRFAHLLMSYEEFERLFDVDRQIKRWEAMAKALELSASPDQDEERAKRIRAIARLFEDEPDDSLVNVYYGCLHSVESR